jgi:hypothetical protein
MSTMANGPILIPTVSITSVSLNGRRNPMYQDGVTCAGCGCSCARGDFVAMAVDHRDLVR